MEMEKRIFSKHSISKLMDRNLLCHRYCIILQIKLSYYNNNQQASSSSSSSIRATIARTYEQVEINMEMRLLLNNWRFTCTSRRQVEQFHDGCLIENDDTVRMTWRTTTTTTSRRHHHHHGRHIETTSRMSGWRQYTFNKRLIYIWWAAEPHHPSRTERQIINWKMFHAQRHKSLRMNIVHRNRAEILENRSTRFEIIFSP